MNVSSCNIRLSSILLCNHTGIECTVGLSHCGVIPFCDSYAVLYTVCVCLCVCSLQVMNLKIEDIAAPRSFLFLWCGSCEGLDLGREVVDILLVFSSRHVQYTFNFCLNNVPGDYFVQFLFWSITQ